MAEETGECSAHGENNGGRFDLELLMTDLEAISGVSGIAN